MDKWEFWLGFAGIIITIIGATVRITRFIDGQNNSLTELVYRKFNEAKTTIDTKFNEAKATIDTESNDLRTEFGETLKALRAHVEKYEEKLYQVELYIRDKYISDPTFTLVINEIKNDIKDLSGKLDKLLQRPVRLSH